MGTENASIISLGFIIPKKKLVALYYALLNASGGTKLESDTGEEPTDGRHAHATAAWIEQRKTTLLEWDEIEELNDLISGALESSGLNRVFGFVIQGMNDEERQQIAITYTYANGDDSRGYVISRWGRDNPGTTFQPLPQLKREDIIEGKTEGYVQKLGDVLHFKEAGIEVSEQWIQSISVH